MIERSREFYFRFVRIPVRVKVEAGIGRCFAVMASIAHADDGLGFWLGLGPFWGAVHFRRRYLLKQKVGAA